MKRHDLIQLISKRRSLSAKRIERSHAPGGLVAFFLLLVISGLFFAAAWQVTTLLKQAFEDLPTTEDVRAAAQHQAAGIWTPSEIYDRSGQVLLDSVPNFDIKSGYISLDPNKNTPFSQDFLDYLVAIEQPDYWQSFGFALNDWQVARPQTIAEKLVKNLVLENDKSGRIETVRMRLLAWQVTKQYGQRQVLEWYLNSAYFGYSLFGIEAASQTYFGKSSANLSLAESAVLLGVLRTPSLNPFDSPEAARENQSEILQELYLAKAIQESELRDALQSPVSFAAAPIEHPTRYPAFTNLVIQQTGSIVGKQTLERGGLKIITSLDVEKQTLGECSLLASLHSLSEASKTWADNQCAPQGENANSLKPFAEGLKNGSILVLDPTTGEVAAMTGEADPDFLFSNNKDHPSGWILSPLAVGATLVEGQNTSSMLWDLPPATTEDEEETIDWKAYLGPISLSQAAALNRNAALSQVVQQHPKQWNDLLSDFGIKDHQKEKNPAENNNAFSTSINLSQVGQVYASLANGGIVSGYSSGSNSQIDLKTVLAIENKQGQSLFKPETAAQMEVFNPGINYLVNSVFSQPNSEPPSSNSVDNTENTFRFHAAYEENTKQQWSAAWSPSLVVVAWAAYPDEASPETTADTTEFMSWANPILKQGSASEPPLWPMPETVTTAVVCVPSGLLPGENCPETIEAPFLKSNIPTETDSMFQTVTVNSTNNKLATVFTPIGDRVEKQFMTIPPLAQKWAEANKVSVIPTDWDPVENPQPNPKAKISFPTLFSYVHGPVTIKGSARTDLFQSYALHVGKGLNPTGWIEIGSSNQPVTNGELGIWDAKEEGIFIIRLSVLDSDQTLRTALQQVTVDNTPPKVFLVYPLANAQITLQENEVLFFQVNAQDNQEIDSISWYLDDTLYQLTNADTQSIFWKPTPGEHKLSVKVSDRAGNSTSLEAIKFYINLP